MAGDLDIRALRYFVAAAEDLHFSRAAARLYVAQQALSRDIARLEERLGTKLFERTTRRVSLTPDGERLLGQARRLLALHDEILRGPADAAPLFVDVAARGMTPGRVLARARRDPALEFFVRFHNGLGESLPLLAAHRLDVTFGRTEGPLPSDVDGQPIRWEPMALLLRDDHPLAARESVPLASLNGVPVCWSTGDHASPEWRRAAHRLLVDADAEPSIEHPHIVGDEEIAHHLRIRDVAVLTLVSQPPVPGTVLRPLVDPVPVYPWRMLWRRGDPHPGLLALREAATALAAEEGWLTRPERSWAPVDDTR
ncbi:LysR family transcriptional regulator [Phytomonospora endophytica]|uniref:DNA-binding transcriptional LysR family regulator n=1 Tax=Phytomonospora endophytica TaxID=714109 RepID=A0A841FKP7_9ACTN|nr:LysR family transcriptional regulator [Phytomonospora endophytica]MBB6036465.1 DNA-binding transcriptional LysR family regulator [Phytomonospora endophytica]GIG65787.1 LysR family transcriptional regulator [Phytomonospora endophytica]